MTPEERARQVPITTHGCECGRTMCETHRAIASALADERRRALEEAAKIAYKKAEEPWKNAAVKREGRSIAYAIRQAVVEPSRESLLRLRDESGYGIVDCQNAMQHSGGDYEKAKTFLREKG